MAERGAPLKAQIPISAPKEKTGVYTRLFFLLDEKVYPFKPLTKIV